MTSTRNLILGAGLAGLSAAFHLRPGETLVVEREREPGGLCRTRRVEGFFFDCTGHLLHLGKGPVREMVLGLLPRVFRSVERRACVFSKGVFTGYPFQANTHGLPPEVVRECVVGFVESLMRKGREEEPDNFRDWVLATFGEGFARHFMFPYNEKLYRVDLAGDGVRLGLLVDSAAHPGRGDPGRPRDRGAGAGIQRPVSLSREGGDLLHSRGPVRRAAARSARDAPSAAWISGRGGRFWKAESRWSTSA